MAEKKRTNKKKYILIKNNWNFQNFHKILQKVKKNYYYKINYENKKKVQYF